MDSVLMYTLSTYILCPQLGKTIAKGNVGTTYWVVMPKVEGHPTQETPYFIQAAHADKKENTRKHCEELVKEMETGVKAAMNNFFEATKKEFIHGDPNPRRFLFVVWLR